MKKTTEELAELRANGDWQALWEIARPIAKAAAVKTLGRAHATQDLMQDAEEAAGKATRTWDPAKGDFSTHVHGQVAGYVRDRANADPDGIGGKHDSRPERARRRPSIRLQDPILIDEGTEEEESAELGDVLTYEATGAVPEGFNEVEEEVRAAKANRAVELSLSGLDNEISDMMRAFYGIDRSTQTWKEYGAQSGHNPRVMAQRQASALDHAKQKLSSRYNQSISPLKSPWGRGPHRTRLPAKTGFWVGGVDAAIEENGTYFGPRDREDRDDHIRKRQKSSGIVWNNWSYRPENLTKGTWYDKHPAKEPRQCPASGMRFAAEAKVYRAPKHIRVLGEKLLLRLLHGALLKNGGEWRADAFGRGAGARVKECAIESEEFLVTMAEAIGVTGSA